MEHFVARGDTLWGIAHRHYGQGAEYTRIAEANGIRNPQLLLIGTKLKVPPKPISASVGSTPKPVAQPQGGRPFFAPAAGVQYMPASFVLERDFKAVEISLPNGKVTVTFKGSLTLTLNRALDILKVDLRKSTLTTQIKSEYEAEFSKTVSKVDYKFNALTGQAEIATGFAVHGKVGNKTFGCTQVQMVPPNRFKFKSEPEPIQGQVGDLHYKGVISCEVEIELNPPQTSSPSPAPVFEWRSISQLAPQAQAAALLVAAAGTVILIAAAPAVASGALVTAMGVALISYSTVQKNPQDYGLSGI